MVSLQVLFLALLSLSLVLAQPTPAPDVCTDKCPPLNFPNPSCLDGTTAVVVCTLQTTGQCGYSISCPRTATPSPAPCTAVECGPEPSFNLPACSNGTRASSTCNRLADNTCLWFSGLCPGEPVPTLSTCTLDDCGPLNFLVSACPDGTRPAVNCGRRVDKSCGYQVQPCASNTTAAPTPVPTTAGPTPAAVGTPCQSNSDCVSKAFCQQLNCNSKGGLCALYDITCPEFNSSVCGCDNTTYRSACAATQARVTVQYGGPCLSGTNATSSPTPANTLAPTPANTSAPTPANTSAPTPANTSAPTPANTSAPTPANTSTPTSAPTSASTSAPTSTPSTSQPGTATPTTTRAPTTLPPIVTYPTPGYVPPASPTPSTTPAPTQAPTPFTPPTPAPPTPPIVFPTPAGSVKSSGPVPTPIFVQPPTYPTPALVFPTARRFRPEDVRPLATPPSSSPTYAQVAPPTPPIITGDSPAQAGSRDNHPYLFNHRNVVSIDEAVEVVDSVEK